MTLTLPDLKYIPDMPKDVDARPIMIIGAGEIIHDAHLPAYKMAGYPVAGIFNRTKAKAERLCDMFNIPLVSDDLDDFIKAGAEKNAVFDIALPANMVVNVLEKIPKGSGVLIQKPMGESLEEAKAILDLCHAKDLVAGINFQLRQAPYMIQLREMLADGLIGEIYDIDWRVTVNHPWHLWSFLNHKERCEINYHSIHYVDAIRSLVGDPQSVYCKTMPSPKAPRLAQASSSIILDYGDKLRVNVSTNHGHDYASDYQESCIKIEGTKGAIRLSLGLILDYPEGRPDKLEYFTYDSRKWQEVPIIGSWFPEAFIGTMGGLLRKLEKPGFRYMNSVEDAYKTMCVVEACYESNAHGATQVNY